MNLLMANRLGISDDEASGLVEMFLDDLDQQTNSRMQVSVLLSRAEGYIGTVREILSVPISAAKLVSYLEAQGKISRDGKEYLFK